MRIAGKPKKLRLISVPSVFGSLMGKWWLAGGITPANCLAAYQAKGVASYAVSKVNLANSGVYDLYDGSPPPDWTTENGWAFDAGDVLRITTGIVLKPYTFITRITPDTWGATNTYFIWRLEGSGVWAGYRFYDNKQKLSAGTTGIGVGATKILTDKVIAGSYSAAGAYVLYINGVVDGVPGTADYAITTATNEIGKASGGYSGIVAAVAIYNIVLNSDQVLAVTNSLLAL